MSKVKVSQDCKNTVYLFRCLEYLPGAPPFLKTTSFCSQLGTPAREDTEEKLHFHNSRPAPQQNTNITDRNY